MHDRTVINESLWPMLEASNSLRKNLSEDDARPFRLSSHEKALRRESPKGSF